MANEVKSSVNITIGANADALNKAFDEAQSRANSFSNKLAKAAALGANIRRVRLIVVAAATLGTAAVVAVSGLIGFVGIIVPHAVRLVVGASYRKVLPLSVLLGGAFLVLVDIPSRVMSDPAEIPIGVVTAFFGAPFFLLLLRTRETAQ